MVKTEEFEVGEHSYAVTQWNATKAFIMKLKLGKYMGGVIESFADSKGDIANTLMGNLSKILEEVNIEEFVDFIKEVACAGFRDGTRMTKGRFDEYFTGDLMEAYVVAFKVIEINYKDFLVSVLSLRKGK